MEDDWLAIERLDASCSTVCRACSGAFLRHVGVNEVAHPASIVS
jgi:hypothetical protein